MTERLVEIKHSELHLTLHSLSDAGFTVDDAAWLRNGNAPLLVDFIRRSQGINPFEQSVDQTLGTLRTQNTVGNWGLDEEVFDQLRETAPAWPKGRDAFRSLRIRWGEADEGVALTFERHVEVIKRAFPGKFWRWEHLRSVRTSYKGKDVERLRLLNGNHTHHATVEWVIMNYLSTSRKRTDVTSVRGPNSLADEGLVLAWLFPSRVHIIDYKQYPAWFCAGYELNVPERDDEEWCFVVLVDRHVDIGRVSLRAHRRDNGYSFYSVPFLESATCTQHVTRE